MAAESLEKRNLLASVVFMNDDWHFSQDVDADGILSQGDIVSVATNSPPFGTYGVTAFGNVATGAHTGNIAAYATLQSAVDATSASGTLNILAGSYSGDTTITKAITVTGEGINQTAIDGDLIAFEVSGAAANLTLSGLTISRAARGVSVVGGNASITNTAIDNNTTGLYVANGATISALNGVVFDGATDNGTDITLETTAGTFTVGGGNKFGGDAYYINNLTSQSIDLTSTTPSANTFDETNNFRIEDKINHKIDDASLGLVTFVVGNVYITTPGGGSTDSNIQRGIDAASVGDNVNIEMGTFAQTVNLNKRVSLLGSGSTAAGTVITGAGTHGIVVTASGADATTRLLISNLRIDGATGDGIHIQSGGGSFTTLDNVAAVNSTSDGVELGAALQDLKIVGSLFSGNSNGLRVPTFAAVDGLAITDSVFSANQYGIEEETTTSGIRPAFTNITLTGVSLLNNVQKGGYFERLSNAVFSGLTVTGNGTAANNNVAGIDLNLKYQTFDSISISGSTFSGNGTGATNGRGVDLNIKARNDAPSYSTTPATITNLDLTNLSFGTGAGVGLALGNHIDLATTTLNGVSFNGSGSGLVIYGNTSGQTFDIGDTSFAASLATFIENGSSGVEIDATEATFAGVVGANATLSEAYAIVDKIIDAVDIGIANGGLVRLQTGSVFVTPASFALPFTSTPSIQRAVDAAAATETVHAQGGTYIDQLVNINKQITLSGANAGNSAAGQANRDLRVTPTLLQASAPGAAMGIQVSAGGAGAVIDGIDFKGTGVFVSEYSHITVLAPNVTVENIVSNSDLSDPFQVSGQNAKGITLGFGVNYDGFMLKDSFFARQRTGVFVSPGSGTNTITIDGNEFASRTPINHDVGFTSLNSTITDNIFGKVNVDGYAYGPATGVNVAVVPSGGTVTFTGNQIASNFIGIDLKDVKSGGTVNITSNVFTDHTGSAVGVKVNSVAGANVVFTTNTFANATFVWDAGSQELDLYSGNNLVDVGSGPVALATADLPTLFKVADHIIDGIDTGSTGMVRIKANEVFVTPNSFANFAPYNTTTGSIQRGLNLANANDQVHVAAGTFTELVTVNKTLSLLGAQAGVDARGRAGAETIVNGAGGSFSLAANGIVLDGFTVEGTINAAVLGAGIFQAATVSGGAIRNNIVSDNIIGLSLQSNGVSQTTVEHNLFADNNNAGPAGGTAIYSDGGLANTLIRLNKFTGDNFSAAVNLIGSSTSVSNVTISGNTFETGNQLVLFNVDNASVVSNQFSGALPNGNTGSGVYVGGGVDTLSITGNTFSDRGWTSIAVADDFGYGHNTGITIVGNTINQNVSLLEASTSIINITDGQGTQVLRNVLTLSGTLGGAVSSVNAISVSGSGTGTVTISKNDLSGVAGGNSAGVRLQDTLTSSASITVVNSHISGFDNGVLGEVLATGVVAKVNGNYLAGNALFAVKNGAGALIDASANWYGSIYPNDVAAAVSGPVDYSPWLNRGDDFDAGARGFLGAYDRLSVDDDSPQAPGYTGRIGEAISLLNTIGSVIIHSGNYTENVSTVGKRVGFGLGTSLAGVTINGSLTLDADDQLNLVLRGYGNDELVVTGTGTFGGATVALTTSQTLNTNAILVLVRRGSGTDFFGNVSQGQQLTIYGQNVTARYDLGDGNDFGLITTSNPIISNVSGSITYVENAPPILVTSTATLTDPDNTNFNGGNLQVLLLSGGQSGDVLSIRNQGTGAGQIGATGGTVTYGGVTIGTYSGGAGGSPLVISFTSNGTATIDAAQALLQNITYFSTSDTPTGPKSIAYVLQDGNSGTGAVVRNVNITPVDDAPVLTLSGQINYTENGAAVILAPNAGVSDVDNTNFGGGSLTISTTTNASSADQLSIVSVGNGAGQIGVSGNTVSYGGTAVGTFSGGTGTTPLVITLNSSATIAATQALTRSIAFSTGGDNPAPNYRTVTFVLNDGAGQNSNTASKSARVIAINDAPQILMQSSRNYAAGTTAIVLSPTAEVTDPDSVNFDTGKLTVSVGNGDAGDRVTIASTGTGTGQISVTGAQVKYEGVLIGTFTGGSGTDPLVVTFNVNASRLAVRGVVRAVAFSTVSGAAPRGLRNVSFVLTDGDGGTSDPTNKPVYVVAPPPSSARASSTSSLSGGGSISYSRGSTEVALLAQGIVSGNVANGKLTVANSGGQDADRVVIGGRFSVSKDYKLLLNGIAVGSVNPYGGNGKTALVITLGSNATSSLVQELTRSINFRTVAQASTNARTVNFTLSANGATSSTNTLITLR